MRASSQPKFDWLLARLLTHRVVHQTQMQQVLT